MLVNACQPTCRHRRTRRHGSRNGTILPKCWKSTQEDDKCKTAAFYLSHPSASVTLSDPEMCWPFTDVHSPWQPTPLRGVQAFHVKQETPRLAVVLSTLTSTSLKRNPLVILLPWPVVVFQFKSIFTQKALLRRRGLPCGNNWKQAWNDIAAPRQAPHFFFQHTCFCNCKWDGSHEPSVYSLNCQLPFPYADANYHLNATALSFYVI